MTRELFFEPFILAYPPDHPITGRAPLAPSALAGEDLLLLEEGHCLRDQALALCTPSAPGVLRRQATGLETLRHLIAAGVGYSLLPTLAVRPGDQLEGLVVYACIAPGPGDEAGSGRRITLVWRASDPRQLSLETLGSYLREATPAGMHPAGDARLTQRAE